MKFIPILFSTPMVQAILDGSKTQTRRTKGLEKFNIAPDLFKNNNKRVDTCRFWDESIEQDPNPLKTEFIIESSDGYQNRVQCAYGKEGDILWVRETFFGYNEEDENKYVYFADGRYSRPWGLSDEYCMNEWGSMNKDLWPKWKPSLFMPKSACRLFLKITNVRVERLQDISEKDAKAEGIKHLEGTTLWYNYIENRFTCGAAKESFYTLWQSINGEQSWSDNPWVWIIEFERIEKTENFI